MELLSAVVGVGSGSGWLPSSCKATGFISERRSEAKTWSTCTSRSSSEIRESSGADLAVLMKDCRLSPPFSSPLEFPFLQLRLQRAFSRFVISTSLPKSVSSAVGGTS